MGYTVNAYIYYLLSFSSLGRLQLIYSCKPVASRGIICYVRQPPLTAASQAGIHYQAGNNTEQWA